MEVSTARIASVSRLLSSAPQTVHPTSVVVSAAFLTGLLAVAVPAVAIATGLPLLVLVGLAGVVYAGALILTDRVFEGLSGAVFVLGTFNANVPLLEAPFGGTFVPTLDLMLVDVAAIPLAALFVVWGVWATPPFERRTETVTGYALAGLAVWATLSAIVSNGPSQPAALFFAVVQFRYLFVFVLGATIVRYVGIRSAAYSLLIAVGGNVAFGVAEVLNRGTFGLSYLGEAPGRVLGQFAIGPLLFQTSMYAGGFVGFSRLLVVMIVLTTPLAVLVLVTGPNWQKALATIGLVGAVFMARVSKSDAGFAALVLAIALSVCALVYVHVTNRATDDGIDYAFGYLGAIGAGALTYLLFSGRVVRDAVTGGTGGGGASGGGTGGGGASGGGTGGATGNAELTDTVLSLVNELPFIDTTTLPIRIQHYAAAIAVGIKYPLFGLGGSNFKLVAESFGSPRALFVHNTPLAYLAATGFPGATFFLVAVLAVLVVAVKNAREANHEERLFWALLVCGMIGFHAITFWNVAHRSVIPYLPFWTLAGAVVGSRYWSAR